MRKNAEQRLVQNASRRMSKWAVCHIVMYVTLMFCSIRSHWNLSGRERSGYSIRGEKRDVCRNEQPRKVIWNGRYACRLISLFLCRERHSFTAVLNGSMTNKDLSGLGDKNADLFILEPSS